MHSLAHAASAGQLAVSLSFCGHQSKSVSAGGLASLREDKSADTACTAEPPDADLTASAACCAFSAFLQSRQVLAQSARMNCRP